MRYTLLILLILSTCQLRNSGKLIKCKVKEITKVYTYPGLLPDYKYKIQTDCNITLFLIDKKNIGDSVSIIVNDK